MSAYGYIVAIQIEQSGMCVCYWCNCNKQIKQIVHKQRSRLAVANIRTLHSRVRVSVEFRRVNSIIDTCAMKVIAVHAIVLKVCQSFSLAKLAFIV